MSVAVEEHMPSLYGAAEATSARGQSRFRRLTAASLCLLILAALGGLIEDDWAGWVSLLAFGASLVASGLWIFNRAEADWYDGRAAAESVKSLTWKYAMHGERRVQNPPPASPENARKIMNDLARSSQPPSRVQPQVTNAGGAKPRRALPRILVVRRYL